jgi:uncharacterized protein (DUF2132 family)
MHTQPQNPLHGVKLEEILKELVATYSREGLAKKIDINCFISNPSIKSSLKFLRNVNSKWARNQVETLYLKMKEQNTAK